jgi:hypothetical protein
MPCMKHRGACSGKAWEGNWLFTDREKLKMISILPLGNMVSERPRKLRTSQVQVAYSRIGVDVGK